MLRSMPDEIQKLMANKEVSRKDKTKLVHETVSRDAQGHWVLNLQNPTLQGLSEQYTTLSGKEKAKGYPRSMIVSKVGGEVALQAAIQRGEIRVVHEKGLEYYMFNTIEIAKTTENRQGASCHGPAVELQEQSQMEAMAGFFENFNPQFSDEAFCSFFKYGLG